MSPNPISALSRNLNSQVLGRHIGLDLLRALAIILTFFVHFVWVIGGWLYRRDFETLSMRDANSALEAFLVWLAHSQHGVFLFFVLSGYLMGRKWFGGAPVSALAFWRDRAWRTLPGAFLAVLAALMLLWGTASWPADPIARYLENAFFLNWFRREDSRALLVVTWSLHAEWLFYLSLPVIAALAKRFFRTSPALGVLIITVAICIGLKCVSLRGCAYAWFFAVGVICAIKQHQWRPIVSRIPSVFVVLLYAAINLVYAIASPSAARLQTALWNPFDTHALFFGACAGLLLLKIAETRFDSSLWVRVGTYIGKISYSIYLWHLLVIIAIGKWLGWPGTLDALGRPAAFLLYAAATLALTWAISALSFRWIEAPYFQRKRRA